MTLGVGTSRFFAQVVDDKICARLEKSPRSYERDRRVDVKNGSAD